MSFCEFDRVAKVNSFVDIEILEAWPRRVLDCEAKRVMCVLDPISILRMDENLDMKVEIPNHPKRSELGTCSMICVSFQE